MSGGQTKYSACEGVFVPLWLVSTSPVNFKLKGLYILANRTPGTSLGAAKRMWWWISGSSCWICGTDLPWDRCIDSQSEFQPPTVGPKQVGSKGKWLNTDFLLRKNQGQIGCTNNLLIHFWIKIEACHFYYKVDTSLKALDSILKLRSFFRHFTVLRAQVSGHGYSITHAFSVHNPVRHTRGYHQTSIMLQIRKLGTSKTDRYLPSQHRPRV